MFQANLGHHQEEKLYLYDTWYLLFCVDDSVMLDGLSIHPA